MELLAKIESWNTRNLSFSKSVNSLLLCRKKLRIQLFPVELLNGAVGE